VSTCFALSTNRPSHIHIPLIRPFPSSTQSLNPSLPPRASPHRFCYGWGPRVSASFANRQPPLSLTHTLAPCPPLPLLHTDFDSVLVVPLSTQSLLRLGTPGVYLLRPSTNRPGFLVIDVVTADCADVRSARIKVIVYSPIIIKIINIINIIIIITNNMI
jgi:hypothetical protein